MAVNNCVFFRIDGTGRIEGHEVLETMAAARGDSYAEQRLCWVGGDDVAEPLYYETLAIFLIGGNDE